MVVPAVIESFLIKRRRFTEGIFINRDFGQPFVNGLWDVFDDAGWIVRLLVDVEWNVSWFVVWLSVTSRKFTTFLLASIVIFRPYLTKMLHNSFFISSACLGDALVFFFLSLLLKQLNISAWSNSCSSKGKLHNTPGTSKQTIIIN